MMVAVGSLNKTKLEPVRQIFEIHYPGTVVVEVDVGSGVGEQPQSDEEIYQGALNRAKKALKKIPEAVYGVGIEGGLHKRSYGWFEHSLVVIVDRQSKIGVGASGGLVLPNKIVKDIKNGMTLEEAIDKEFGTNKIGQGIGMFGLFTKGVVTRTSGVAHGVAFALARFLHKDIYEKI